MDIARLLNRDHEIGGDVVCSSAPPPQTSVPPTRPSPTCAMPASAKMDIAGLLNRDESEHSDHDTAVGVDYSPQPTPPRGVAFIPPPRGAVIPVLPSQRAVARPRSHRPRKPSNQRLQAQLEAYEFVLAHLPYVMSHLDDITLPASAPTSDAEESSQDKAQRIRTFLKRTIMLSEQAREEIAKRTEYLRLLKCRSESATNIRKLMRGLVLNEWFWMCERWRDLALEHYEPLPKSQCKQIVQETLHAIETHTLPEGTRETGADAFGWRDAIHLDADGRYVRFLIRKTLQDANIEQVADHAWSLYSDGDLFRKAHIGENCDFFLQVLQRISPDVIIIQRVEKYPDLKQPTHSLALCFRVQTETGYIIAFRCIESPRLQNLLKADGLSLSGNFWWDTFDVAHRDAQGECDAIRFTMAGSIGSDIPSYAKRWRDEIVVSLVRYEIEFMDKPILSIESSTEEDPDTNSTIQS